MLDKMLANPNDVQDPLALADILYNCNYLSQAAIFYKRALDIADSNLIDSYAYKDKAWLIYQTGNCLQKIDSNAASAMYKKLINEYPDSIWANPAKAKNRLIEWYIQQKPETIVNKGK